MNLLDKHRAVRTAQIAREQHARQYPEPKLSELDRASLRDLASGSSTDAEAELAHRTPRTA